MKQEADDLEDEGGLEDNQEDVYDELLDAKLSMTAANKEMAYMEQLEVGIKSTEEECWAKTRKAPVTTKWVRVVARDFETTARESFFAAMPTRSEEALLPHGCQRRACLAERQVGEAEV